MVLHVVVRIVHLHRLVKIFGGYLHQAILHLLRKSLTRQHQDFLLKAHQGIEKMPHQLPNLVRYRMRVLDPILIPIFFPVKCQSPSRHAYSGCIFLIGLTSGNNRKNALSFSKRQYICTVIKHKAIYTV